MQKQNWEIWIKRREFLNNLFQNLSLFVYFFFLEVKFARFIFYNRRKSENSIGVLELEASVNCQRCQKRIDRFTGNVNAVRMLVTMLDRSWWFCSAWCFFFYFFLQEICSGKITINFEGKPSTWFFRGAYNGYLVLSISVYRGIRTALESINRGRKKGV